MTCRVLIAGQALLACLTRRLTCRSTAFSTAVMLAGTWGTMPQRPKQQRGVPAGLPDMPTLRLHHTLYCVPCFPSSQASLRL